MPETITQLPRTQLRGKYTQDAAAALWIGDARCVVLQLFATFGTSEDEVSFYVDIATQRDDSQFVDLGIGQSLDGSTGADQTFILLIPYTDTPGFLRMRIVPNPLNSEPVVVSVQANLKS